jgi:glycosyltransferase involved in cell wall biosynthesis
MKIMQVMAGAEFGGAEEFFMRLTPALARAGVDQRVVIRKHDGRAERLRHAGIEPVELAFGGFLDISTTRKLVAEIEAFEPQIVMSWMNRASLFCSRAAARSRHPFVRIGRLGGYYQTKYYRGFDHLIGNTPHIVEYLVGEGWPGEAAHFVPNFVAGPSLPAVARPSIPAVARQEFHTPADAPLVLALGRLHRNKAFDVLIRAMADIPGAFLWLAGEGGERAALERDAMQAGVADRVRFLGWRNDISGLLATADMLVCPSRVEPLGNVVIEAWAHDVPVVAASSAGPAWLIEQDRTGLLVPVEDPPALAAAVRRLIAEQSLAARLAVAGHGEYDARFTEAAVVRRYMDLFEKVAG